MPVYPVDVNMPELTLRKKMSSEGTKRDLQKVLNISRFNRSNGSRNLVFD